MKRLVCIMAIMCLIFSAGIVFAQTTIDGDEMISVPKSKIPANVLNEIETNQKIETVGKYVGIGKEVGEAVNGSLSAITTNAEKFANTKAGKFTMFIVAWKVIGKNLIQLIVGILLAIMFYPTFFWSYFQNCRPRNILTKEDGKVKEYRISEPCSDSLLGHAVTFIIVTGIILLVIFV